MLTLDWRQCGADQHWCSLFGVDLNSSKFRRLDGIYIIWHETETREVIRVGRGDIRARIEAHRKDPVILAYKEKGPVYVSWAIVESTYLGGVERYLVEVIQPLYNSLTGKSEPIEVNVPARWMRLRSKESADAV